MYYVELWLDGKREQSDYMDLGACCAWLRLALADVVTYKKSTQIAKNIKKQFDNEENTARCGWQDSSIMCFVDIIKAGTI